MQRIYASPLRVYLIIAFLAFIGIWTGTKLPVSLFPNSSQPKFSVGMDFVSYSAEDFKRLYGDALEASLQGIITDQVKVERVEFDYKAQDLQIDIVCTWGSNPDSAKREIELVLSSITATMPEEVRRSLRVWSNGGESSAYAISFTSNQRTVSELNQYLEPLLVPEIGRLPDVGSVSIFSPTRKEVRLELDPEQLAQMDLTTVEIEGALIDALGARNGGSVATQSGSLPITMPRLVHRFEDLQNLILALPGGRSFPLAEIANIRYDTSRDSTDSFKLDGAPTTLLWVTAKPGANLKRMADQTREVMARLQTTMAKDISSRVILDPSEFIGSAIANVMKEVVIGSLLASLILFLFIGSLRNVATAAIEIPISIALAFIMMRIFNMNMNLLSLAGLALASGMNVDASVVVMENIFRHFKDQPSTLDIKERLRITCLAVDEVKFPVIASTVASLVVFLPFMFIDGLSYAILGDLAKALIFSHGFSAIIALLLVPTVRLHLMNGKKGTMAQIAFADRPLHWLENSYIILLTRILPNPRKSLAIFSLPLVLLLGLCLHLLPGLPREIIGKPEADWIGINASVDGHTTLRQMESFIDLLHHDLDQKHPSIKQSSLFVLDMIHGANRAEILFKVKDRRQIGALHKELEAALPSLEGRRYEISEWSPSEFRLPDSRALRVSINGGDAESRMIAARDLKQSLESLRVLRDIWSRPNMERQSNLRVTLDAMVYSSMVKQGFRWTPSNFSEVLRVSTKGKWLGQILIDGQDTPINIGLSENAVQGIDDIESYPLNFHGTILPLKALAQVEELEIKDRHFSENGREMLVLMGTLPEEKQAQAMLYQKQLKDAVTTWNRDRLPELGLPPMTINLLESNRDLADGMRQLRSAFIWSIALLFLTIFFQFANLYESLLILVAVPLGLLGAVASLALFHSTLSVNAVLGMILLNGIAVNNSIILVDFARRLFGEGMSPEEAILVAARKRLRPILITTLTTMLAMLPIAVGYGEGGRVLQPLGIVVVGGLWLSTLLTLLLVPLLHSMKLHKLGKLRVYPSKN